MIDGWSSKVDGWVSSDEEGSCLPAHSPTEGKIRNQQTNPVANPSLSLATARICDVSLNCAVGVQGWCGRCGRIKKMLGGWNPPFSSLTHSQPDIMYIQKETYTVASLKLLLATTRALRYCSVSWLRGCVEDDSVRWVDEAQGMGREVTYQLTYPCLGHHHIFRWIDTHQCETSNIGDNNE